MRPRSAPRSRRRIVPALAAVMVPLLATAVVLAGQSPAASSRQPGAELGPPPLAPGLDVMARPGSQRAWAGAAERGGNPATGRVVKKRGGRAIFYVRACNNAGPQRVRFTGSRSGAGFAVRYFRGSHNITAGVSGPGWRSARIRSGGCTAKIRIAVIRGADTPSGARRLVRLRAHGPRGDDDLIRLRVTAG